MVYLRTSSDRRSPSISRLYMLTTAENHDYCMARLIHERMAIDSKIFSALTVDLFYSDIVLTLPLIHSSGWETHAGGSVLFSPSK